MLSCLRLGYHCCLGICLLLSLSIAVCNSSVVISGFLSSLQCCCIAHQCSFCFRLHLILVQIHLDHCLRKVFCGILQRHLQFLFRDVMHSPFSFFMLVMSTLSFADLITGISRSSHARQYLHSTHSRVTKSLHPRHSSHAALPWYSLHSEQQSSVHIRWFPAFVSDSVIQPILQFLYTPHILYILRIAFITFLTCWTARWHYFTLFLFFAICKALRTICTIFTFITFLTSLTSSTESKNFKTKTKIWDPIWQGPARSLPPSPRTPGTPRPLSPSRTTPSSRTLPTPGPPPQNPSYYLEPERPDSPDPPTSWTPGRCQSRSAMFTFSGFSSFVFQKSMHSMIICIICCVLTCPQPVTPLTSMVKEDQLENAFIFPPFLLSVQDVEKKLLVVR